MFNLLLQSWESPLWLPQKSYGFHSVPELAISCFELLSSFCKAYNAVKSNQSILQFLLLPFLPYQSSRASTRYPNALTSTCTSSQLTIGESFSSCDACRRDCVLSTYHGKTMPLPSGRWAIQPQNPILRVYS